MKVITIVRTRNEAKNIGRFLHAYQGIADEILVADGGSTDGTQAIAHGYSKTTLFDFRVESRAVTRMDLPGGHWVNPQGAHVNFLIDRALERNPDWIIFDDCDCVPNIMLRATARINLYAAQMDGMPAAYARRVYMYGTEHFPDLHMPGLGLWAWRPQADIRANETDPLHLTVLSPGLRPVSLNIDFPSCLLHRSWPTPEETEVKLKYYRESGIQPGARHPTDFGGELKKTQWFMYDEGDHGTRPWEG